MMCPKNMMRKWGELWTIEIIEQAKNHCWGSK